MRVLLCQGFAGAFALGAVRAGFRLAGMRELLGGFGVSVCEANRHLLPGAWEAEVGPGDGWTPARVGLLAGNPPCSGFSILSNREFRGPESVINSCMWELVRLAARCTGEDRRPGPELVVFESVQTAYRQGRGLMAALLRYLREATGQPYELTHTLMSGASVGSAQLRPRYFFVAHRVPFGIESPRIREVTTTQDAIGDLMGLDTHTWLPQPYRRPPSSWARPRRRQDGLVAEHVSSGNNLLAVMEALAPWWEPGENAVVAMRRMQESGADPDVVFRGMRPPPPRLRLTGDSASGMVPRRIRPDGPAWVVTGGDGGCRWLHWAEPRGTTVREHARLMGFPDDWTLAPRHVPPNRTTDVRLACLHVGKQLPVESARWIAGWARSALEGRPGAWEGEKVGPHERLVDVTHDYKAVYHPRLRQKGMDGRSRELRRAMEARPA